MKILGREITAVTVKRGIIIASASLVLLIILIFILNSMVMPYIVRLGDESVVPSIVGMDIETAKSILKDEGFKWEISSEEFSTKKPKFTILNQYPPAGLKVKSGRTIEIVLSKGGESSFVEELRGYTLRQAKLRLMEDGLQPGLVTYDYDDNCGPGTIIRTYPPAGAEVKAGTTVDLVLNLHKGEKLILVPDYIGMELGEVEKDLEDKGLAMGDIDYVESDSVLPETVLSQSLVAGMEVELNTIISFTVSKPSENR